MTGSENQIGREMVTYSSFKPLEFLIFVEQVPMQQEQEKLQEPEQIVESQPEVQSDQTTDITLFTPTGETWKIKPVLHPLRKTFLLKDLKLQQTIS